jgi:hypothetical protein
VSHLKSLSARKQKVIHILKKYYRRGKFHPRTGRKCTERECRYSSTLSLTSALDWGGWLMPCPGCFYFRKRNMVTILRESGWAPAEVWTSAEKLAITDIRHSYRPVMASRYNDWAIAAHVFFYKNASVILLYQLQRNQWSSDLSIVSVQELVWRLPCGNVNVRTGLHFVAKNGIG